MNILREEVSSKSQLLAYEISQLYRYEVNDYITYIQTKHVNTWKSFMESDIHIFCSCPDFEHRCAKFRSRDNSLYLNPEIKKFFKNKGLTIDLRLDGYEWKSDPNDLGVCKHCIAAMNDLRVNFMLRSFGQRSTLTKLKSLL